MERRELHQLYEKSTNDTVSQSPSYPTKVYHNIQQKYTKVMIILIYK